MKSPVYQQKFDQFWLWFGLGVSTLVTLVLIGNALKDEEELFWKIYGVSIILIVAVVFGGLLIAKLQIYVDEDKIVYRFFPIYISWRDIQFDDIKHSSLATFDAVDEFGGWGVRKNKAGTRALIVKGNLGVKLDLKDRKPLILGMENEKIAQEFIDSIPSGSNNQD